ncbi:MAG: phosphatase PAP2 family protein [Candidatus Hodarchaeota archaeon]
MEFKEFSNKIDQWDQKIILKYNGLGGKSITVILRIISFLGRETLWLLLIAFYLFIWYDPFLLAYISGIFLTGLILILAIKQIVKRKRPFERFKNDKITVLERMPSSRSFPSWHSYNVMAQGLLFGIFFLNSLLVTILIVIIAIIVSFSRIQLGVHYPSDVIFGCIFGIIGFLITIFITSPLILQILRFFERIMEFEIQYRQINSMIFKNIGYFLLIFSILLTIFLLAINKKIKERFKKK